MTRNRLKQALAAVLVVLVAAAPLSGAVCTMSCSDGGGACCCENTAGLGTVQLTAESCCADEASSPAVSNLSAERLTGSNLTSFSTAATLNVVPDTDDPAESGQGPAALPHGQASERSSPLFLLNSSFLI
jgi:hypothetical protein